MALGPYTGERLLKLHDQRHTELGNWRIRWEEISQYVMPQQRSFITTPSPGDRRNEQALFDSTALECNERLATRLHEALTNPASLWFRYEYTEEKLNKDDAAREWLDACERKVRDALANASNFDMTMGQLYLDLGSIGSSAIHVEETIPTYPRKGVRFYGLTFRHIHLSEVSVAEGADGTIRELGWKFELTAEHWVQRFGENCPPDIKKANEENPDKKFPVLVFWFERALTAEPSGDLLPKERPWAEVWIDCTSKAIVVDGGTYEKPFFVARWRKKSHDIMGYGPGERALPTLRTINRAEELELAAWAKSIDPPMKTTMNNIVGNLNAKTAGLTTVRNIDNLELLGVDPDIQHHMIELEDKRNQVREIFRYHSLELPPREQVGEMTAYEVAKRVEQVYRALGPVVVQSKADVLNDMMQRVFNLMYRKGQFPPPPRSVKRSKTGINIQYVGAMAMSQRAIEIEAIDRFVADAIALEQSGAVGAMDIVDLDNAQRHKATIMAVPAIAMRSTADVMKIRQARAAAQQRAAQQQEMMNQADALNKLGGAVGEETMKAAVQNMADNALEA